MNPAINVFQMPFQGQVYDAIQVWAESFIGSEAAFLDPNLQSFALQARSGRHGFQAYGIPIALFERGGKSTIEPQIESTLLSMEARDNLVTPHIVTGFDSFLHMSCLFSHQLYALALLAAGATIKPLMIHGRFVGVVVLIPPLRSIRDFCCRLKSIEVFTPAH